MKKKGLIIILSVFVIAFYAAILAYIFYAMFPVWFLVNFNSALMFELIGLVFLAFTVMEGVISKSVKVGYFVPRVMITITYVIILHILNIGLVIATPHVFFVLLNLVLLFVYCLLSIPMCIMGRK